MPPSVLFGAASPHDSAFLSSYACYHRHVFLWSTPWSRPRKRSFPTATSDSLILPKVLDTILMMDGTFDFAEVQIGRTREEPSRGRIRVSASTGPALDEILRAIRIMAPWWRMRATAS